MGTVLKTYAHNQIRVVGNPREDLGDLEGLLNDIKAHGLLQPLAGCPDPKDKTKVIVWDGRRRYECLCKIPKLKGAIPILVDTEVDPTLAALRADVHRKSLNPIERARAIRTIMDGHNWKQKQAADFLGMKLPLVSQLLKLLEQPAVVQKAVVEKKITQTQAREIARVDDETAKKKMLTAAIEGKPVEDLKEMAEGQLEKEKRAKGKADTPRRGRPTKKETARPPRTSEETSQFAEFNLRTFRAIYQGYEFAFHALRCDTKAFPTAKVPARFERKVLPPTEAAFLEGMYKTFRFVLGLEEVIKMEGLGKLKLPDNPAKPVSSLPKK